MAVPYVLDLSVACVWILRQLWQMEFVHARQGRASIQLASACLAKWPTATSALPLPIQSVKYVQQKAV